MAKLDLDNIKLLEKDRNTIHSKVRSTYSTFEIDRNKYIQIDTYGKGTRKDIDKISQSFQIDKQDAEYLIKLFKEYFQI